MRILSLTILLVFFAIASYGQHHHGHTTPQPKTKKKPTQSTKQKPPRKKTPKQTTQSVPAKKRPAASTVTPASSAPAGRRRRQKSTGSSGHEHHHEPATGTAVHTHQGHDTTSLSGGHDQHVHAGDSAHGHHDMAMSHAFSRNLPMNRNGTGTAWLPDNSAMYGYMLHAADWMFMFHGNVFLRYNSQDFTGRGTRGGAKVDAPAMLMAMGQRLVGRAGLFHFNVMLSPDAIIAGGSGYPLLFQSGETWQGQPLIDRQHPHDFFSELSVSYAHAFSRKADAFVYVGYPGEPALGPVTFMHRPSGMFNPDAPISHHWVDATHITFGVATLGIRYGAFKLEGSSFTGREPDENRFNFDKPRFDSRSIRLSCNPSRYWALQVSHGYLQSPETSHPDDNVYRSSASATYSNRLGCNNFFDFTALWGANKVRGVKATNALLAEATLRLQRLAVYSRYEWVQKSAEELGLEEPAFDHHDVFQVHALTLGSSFDVLTIRSTRFAIGAQLATYRASRELDPLYGRYPLSGQVYLHIYPSLMQAALRN